jgi:hypothetical protein
VTGSCAARHNPDDGVGIIGKNSIFRDAQIDTQIDTKIIQMANFRILGLLSPEFLDCR